ncbi:MAG: hypothetical protein ACXWC0_09385, partial [Burkholderiales bacterium]
MDMLTPPGASETDSSDAAARLDWPTPHHFRILREQTEDLEPGVVTMNDGRKLVGNVVQLDAFSSVLEFQPHDMEATSRIKFSELKSVCLTRTIDLLRVPLAGPAEITEDHPASGPQKCTVEFRDGLDLVLDIVGIVVKEYGLFLFFGNSSNDVQRWFIPMDAIAKYQIGDPLGKILVDRHLVDAESIDAGLEKQH